MGYFNDQEGIINRYIREADQWKQHLENTKEAILRSAGTKRKQKIAILGSGWLLDVPIAELSSMFEQVWLFDIKHPAQIRKRLEKIANIKFVEADISGFAVTIYNRLSKKTKSQFAIESIRPIFDFSLDEFDMVVSCNVLNQLDILIIDYMKGMLRISTDTEIELRKLIQETHIHLLPKSRSCLISDVEELSVDEKNNSINRKTLVYTDLLPEKTENEWIWHFDTHLTYRRGVNTWFRVVALNL